MFFGKFKCYCAKLGQLKAEEFRKCGGSRQIRRKLGLAARLLNDIFTDCFSGRVTKLVSCVLCVCVWNLDNNFRMK